MALTQITTDGIKDGTITNADIGSSAAISGSKVSPDFGSQTVTSGYLTLSAVNPNISFTDSNDNPDFKLEANSGQFKIIDTTNNADRLVVNSDGHVDITGNLDVGAGLDVTGSLTTDGDLEISSANPKIYLTDTDNNSDYIVQNNNGAFRVYDNTNSSQRFIIGADGQAYFTQELNAQGGLDVTGNITVSGTVDGRDVAADGTKLDGIEASATADQTASEILTLIKTVDGAGSGLDADTLDGVDSTSFVRSDANDLVSGLIQLTSSSQYPLDINGSDNGKLLLRGSDNPYIRFRSGNTDKGYVQYNTTDSNVMYVWNQHHNKGLRLGDELHFYDGSYRKIWHELNDGSGSGLDADLLDGVEASGFVRTNNGAQDINGSLTCSDLITAGAVLHEGDTNTLVHFDSADNIAFKTGGTTRMRIHNSLVRMYRSTVPDLNNTYDLGSTSLRWRNIYTNDLNLSNEGGANDVDGTWGSYTIQEGAEDLFLVNKRSGKKYKFNLTEVN